MFLTGFGGTGKSYVVDRIMEDAKEDGKNVIVCAPTGIAALNVGGMTIHRTFGMKGGDSLRKGPMPIRDRNSPLFDCDMLIIDEVSMCRADVFDKVASTMSFANMVRESRGKPPCQMILVGDFYQLRPILPNRDVPVLNEFYGRDVGCAYAFSGDKWSEYDFDYVELTECVRQKDAEFVSALNACRRGDLSGLDWIASHCSSSESSKAMTICSKNKEVDARNEEQLALLSGPVRSYHARKDGSFSDDEVTAPRILGLKRSARVMALVNDPKGRYVNGSLGTVAGMRGRAVLVDLDDGRRVTMEPHKWEITRPVMRDGRIDMDTVGTFEQIPLRLAYASTVHKAQGLTLPQVNLKMDQCWELAQVYTMMSRGVSLAGTACISLPDDEVRKRLLLAPEVDRFMEEHFGGSYGDVRTEPEWNPRGPVAPDGAYRFSK